MKHRYDISGKEWIWDDEKKERELKNNSLRFLVVFAHFFKLNDKFYVRKVPIAFAAFAVYKESGSSLDHIYLHELQVKQEYRSLGIGKRVLLHVEKIGISLGGKMTILTVLKNNLRAIYFYTNLGYSLDESSPEVCYETDQISYAIYSKIHDTRVLTHPCFNHFVTKGNLRKTKQRRTPVNVSSSVGDSLSERRFMDEKSLNFDLFEQNQVLETDEELSLVPCTKSFRFLDSLKRHICVEHTGDFPFYCEVKDCTKGFVTLNDLKQHEFYHHHMKLSAKAIGKGGVPRDPIQAFAMKALQSSPEIQDSSIDINELAFIFYHVLNQIIQKLEAQEAKRNKEEKEALTGIMKTMLKDIKLKCPEPVIIKYLTPEQSPVSLKRKASRLSKKLSTPAPDRSVTRSSSKSSKRNTPHQVKVVDESESSSSSKKKRKKKKDKDYVLALQLQHSLNSRNRRRVNRPDIFDPC